MGSQRVAMLLRGYFNGVDGCGAFEAKLDLRKEALVSFRREVGGAGILDARLV